MIMLTFFLCTEHKHSIKRWVSKKSLICVFLDLRSYYGTLNLWIWHFKTCKVASKESNVASMGSTWIIFWLNTYCFTVVHCILILVKFGYKLRLLEGLQNFEGKPNHSFWLYIANHRTWPVVLLDLSI